MYGALVMEMMTDKTLLAGFVTDHSEQAFRELVSRYINLVYSTAVRLVNSDTHLAEDVTQVVFADLARLAGTLSPGVMLGGWLHRRTCHVAFNTMRSMRRRQNRERQAAEMNRDNTDDVFVHLAPILDEATNQLGAKDRQAIMLRYFENRDLRTVGDALGVTEDAAQKRVVRALDKLRCILVRRGVVVSSSVLATVISAHAVSAAPASLTVIVSNAALSSAAASSCITLTHFKFMAMSQVKVAISTMIVAGIGTILVLDYRAIHRLREENHALRQQMEQPTQSVTAPSPMQTVNTADVAQIQAQQSEEKIRLQNQIGALKQQSNDLSKLRQEHRRLSSLVAEPEDPTEAEYQKEQQTRINNSKQWGLFFHLYANNNNNQVPGSFEKIATSMGADSMLEYATNNLEIVYSGSLSNISPDAIIIKERQPKLNPKGEWVKVYGFADGRVEVRTEADETAFAEWEKKHTVEQK